MDAPLLTVQGTPQRQRLGLDCNVSPLNLPARKMGPDRVSAPAEPSADLRRRLREVALPAVSDAHAWQRMIEGAEDLDATYDRVAADLPLTLSLLAEAARSPRIAASLSGLQHVLRMLGSNGLKSRLQRWSAGRLDPAQPVHREVLQALATSRLACLIHARWMRHGRVADAEYRLWVTALLGVARWKLPLIDLELARAIEHRVERGAHRLQVERALLGGLDLDALGIQHLQDLGFADAAQLAARMRLPARLIAEAARRARDDGLTEALPPQLARPLREPLVSCALAHALALETQANWHAPRCALLVRAAATCLNRPPSGVLADLQRAALEASDEPLYTRGLLAPAARMIRLPMPREARSATSASATPAAGAPAPLDAPVRPPVPNVAVQRPTAADHLIRCRDGAYSSLAEFLSASTRYLVAAGLTRFALFLRMKQPERLAAYFAHGFTDNAAARQTRFAPDAGPLLARLLADPRAAFWIQPRQLAGVRDKLPRELADWSAQGGFLLATIRNGEAPIGFLWADCGASVGPVDAEQFATLRRLAAVFGAEFARLLKAQRDAARSAP